MWPTYFPVETTNITALDPSPFPKPLDDQQLMEAMEHAAPATWKAKLKEQHVTRFDSFQAMRARYKDIQDAGEVLNQERKMDRVPKDRDEDRQSKKRATPDPKERRSRNRGRANKDSRTKKHKGGDAPTCKHCGRIGHDSDDCWTLEKNKKNRPDTRDDRKPAATKSVRFNDKDKKKDKKEQSNMIELTRSQFGKLVRDARRGKKRPSIHDRLRR